MSDPRDVLKNAKKNLEKIKKLLQDENDEIEYDKLSKLFETADKNVEDAEEAVKRMKCVGIGCKNLVLELEPDGMDGYLNLGSLPDGIVQGYTQQKGDGLLCEECHECPFCGIHHDHQDECDL
jgi:hypothetical protein